MLRYHTASVMVGLVL